MNRNKSLPPVEGESFPRFADGDVKIVITGSRQYQLHSGVLKNASPVMRDLLATERAADLSRRAVQKGAVIRHRLVLVSNDDAQDEDQEAEFVLEQVPLDDKGLPSGANPAGVGLELEEGRNINPTFLVRAQLCGIDVITTDMLAGLRCSPWRYVQSAYQPRRFARGRTVGVAVQCLRGDCGL